MHSVGTPQYQQIPSERTLVSLQIPNDEFEEKRRRKKEGRGGALVKVIMGSRFSGMWNEIYWFVLTNIFWIMCFLWPGQTFIGKTACEGVVTGQQLHTLRGSSRKVGPTLKNRYTIPVIFGTFGIFSWSMKLKKCDTGAILPGKSLICKNNTDCGHFFGTKKYRTHGTFFRKTAKKYRTYGTFADTRRKVPYVRYSLGVFPTNLALSAKKYRTYGT